MVAIKEQEFYDRRLIAGFDHMDMLAIDQAVNMVLMLLLGMIEWFERIMSQIRSNMG